MSATGSGTLGGGGREVVRFEVDVKNLYVRRVSLGSDHELSRAVFGVHPQDSGGRDIRIEDAWSIVKKGQQVKVSYQQGQDTQKVVIFHGWVQLVNIRAGGRTEDLEYTALGLDWGLHIERLFGSWCSDAEGKKSIWLRATQPVFNKDGKYNKHTEDLKDDGEDGDSGIERVCFDLDDDVLNPKSAWWPASEMVRYCVQSERKGALSDAEGRIFNPKNLRGIGGELGEFRPFDVNVEGEDIWSAVVKIAARCSYGVSMKYDKDRTKPSLRFFTKKLDEAKQTKQVELPRASLGPIAISDPTKAISSIDAQSDLSGIVRRIDAVAPPKLYEREWDLHAGWKKEDEDAAFGGGSVAVQLSNFLRATDPERSTDWERFKYVGRRFILNETGRDDDCDSVGSQNGDTEDGGQKPFDFSEAFGGDLWAPHNRPFRHQQVSTDESGTPKQVRVRIQWKAVEEDAKLGEHVELLHDRAGVYFRGGPAVMIPPAIASGDVADIFPSGISIEAVVEGDQDAPHDVNGVLGSEDQPVPTFGLIRLDDGFRENNVDDFGAAREKAQKLCDEAVSEHKGERLVGTVTTPWITFEFEVGDVIDRINGRNLKVKALIAKVSHDAITQSTELALHYPEIDTQTHSRHHARQHPSEHWTAARTSHQTQLIEELLAQKAMGHPVDEALGMALGGKSPSVVGSFLNRTIAKPNRALDRDAPDGGIENDE